MVVSQIEIYDLSLWCRGFGMKVRVVEVKIYFIPLRESSLF